MKSGRYAPASHHPVVRARWIILLVFTALCAWVVPGVAALSHDDDVLAFLPPDHPDVVAFRDVANRFGMLEVALVGLYADGEDLRVPARTEQVRALAVAISERPGVRLVLSYPDLPDPRVEGETLVVEPLVPQGATDIRARVSRNRNAVGNLVSADGTAAVLLVYLLPAEDLAARAESLEGVRAVVEAGWDGQAHFGGGPFAQSAAALSSRADIERLSPAVIAVLAVASAVLLGSAGGAALNLVVTGLGVGLVVGAHGRFGESLTIVSSTIPVMMVALGGAFGMHIIAGYQRQPGTPCERASATVRELGLPVTLSGITTAIAFFALLAMPQVPMQRFGLVAGCGVLLLLALSLLVLPALLAALPAGLLKTRDRRTFGHRRVPPLWVLGVLATVGVGLAAGLSADPDTRNVFDDTSEPARADAFLAEHFGGSQFVQIAVEGDLREPAVLRAVRSVAEPIAALEGVSDVRSLLEPVALLTEGFGGRAGVPATPGRARRVISSLADQAPMAQLMTADQRRAIVHVKLAPASSSGLQDVTERIRSIVARADAGLVDGGVRIGSTANAAVAAARAKHVRQRVEAWVGKQLSGAQFESIRTIDPEEPTLRQRLVAVRHRALGTDEVIEPLDPRELEQVPLSALVTARGDALQAVLRRRLPTLVATDPEGVRFVAEQLGQWADEVVERRQAERACEILGLPVDEGLGPRGRCSELMTILSELSDAEWSAGPGVPNAAVLRHAPLRFVVTGQPVVGLAFAESVRRSLTTSTLVSLAALALTLVAAGHPRALVPAVWTLAVTGGTLAVLGHPISIGTSVVSCIALGAGVDFAIHLAVRAKAEGGDGRAAVDALGVVVLITGVQLALAFLVLLSSQMPPLRQFGVGLAVGLLVAAAGAVWFTPRLYRARPRR